MGDPISLRGAAERSSGRLRCDGLDEPGVDQLPEVERDEGSTHAESCHQVADRSRAIGLQLFVDAPPLRFAEHADGLEVVVAGHAVSVRYFRQYVLTELSLQEY
jgi:hypothetical protein